MARWGIVVVAAGQVLLAGGCGRGGFAPLGGDGVTTADGPRGADAPGLPADAAVDDAAVDGDGPVVGGVPDGAPAADAPPALPSHLLISEVRTNGNDEFVEIYNGTGVTVALADYYLTDV